MLGHMGATRLPAFSPARLVQSRLDRGWSQGRLAVALDVSINTVGAWERGDRTPAPPVFLTLAQQLKVEPASLLSVPRGQWTMLELRVAAGLYQAAAAHKLDISATVLRHIELAYAEVPAAQLEEFAAVYQSTPDEIVGCWKRTRTQLLAQ